MWHSGPGWGKFWKWENGVVSVKPMKMCTFPLVCSCDIFLKHLCSKTGMRKSTLGKQARGIITAQCRREKKLASTPNHYSHLATNMEEKLSSGNTLILFFGLIPVFQSCLSLSPLLTCFHLRWISLSVFFKALTYYLLFLLQYFSTLISQYKK